MRGKGERQRGGYQVRNKGERHCYLFTYARSVCPSVFPDISTCTIIGSVPNVRNLCLVLQCALSFFKATRELIFVSEQCERLVVGSKIQQL